MDSGTPATNIKIDQGNHLSRIPGQTGSLTATVLPVNHSDGEVVWTSDNKNYVTVSNLGPTNATYRAVAIGRATIIAKVGNVFNAITINVVSNQATNITINEGEALSNIPGNTGTLTATVLPADHEDGDVVWTSSDTSSVTIIKAGPNSATYTAEAIGRATVTARAGNQTDTITIEVNLPATAIEIANGNETINTLIGNGGTLTATVTPQDHTSGEVKWSSSPENIVSITSIGANTATYTTWEQGRATITARVGSQTDTIAIMVSNYPNDATKVDDDSNGLIEIFSLIMLHNMRYNLAGTSYKVSNSDAGDTNGCPAGGCNGYELVRNLSFDADRDGRTWSGSAGSYTLDEGDSNTVYFNVSQGGWEPIGDASDPFTAIFEGNDFTITGLGFISSRNGIYFGMFGRTDNAQIRNLGLIDNLADYTGSRDSINIGGLVGRQDGGNITASYVTGNVDGGNDGGLVGGLVGRQADSSSIVASYATTGAVGGGDDGGSIGGLVGLQQQNAIIIASYATVTVIGGEGRNNNISVVGGLVGTQVENTIIIASYATGAVDGVYSGGFVGGLVGQQIDSSRIVASYATGAVDGWKIVLSLLMAWWGLRLMGLLLPPVMALAV